MSKIGEMLVKGLAGSIDDNGDEAVNGYNGPYETAITADGQIVADFITSGSLVANIIKAGVIQSQDGSSYWDLESGEVVLRAYATSKEVTEVSDSASASYNTKFFDVATFIDNSDPLQIIVTSTGGDVFKNGQGTTVLTAVCYQAGSEVDTAGNGSYTWTKYSKDGVVDTSWGTNGSKTGKTLSVSSADVDTKATFMVVVAL